MKWSTALVFVFFFSVGVDFSNAAESRESLNRYTDTFRREAGMLLSNVNADTRRSYLRLIDESIRSMEEAHASFLSEYQVFLDNLDSGNLVTRLRLAIDARKRAAQYQNRILFSNTLMASIAAYTKSHGAPDVDQQMTGISSHLSAVISSIDKRTEKLLSQLEALLQDR